MASVLQWAMSASTRRSLPGLVRFVVSEAESLQAVEVIGQVEVNVECLAADCACFLGIGGQHGLVRGCDERVGAERLPRLCGVLGCGVSRMRTGRAARGQLEQLGSQRSEHATTLRHSVFIELVEVVIDRVDRLAEFLVRLGVADANTGKKRPGWAFSIR
jgi:hypothetical protein